MNIQPAHRSPPEPLSPLPDAHGAPATLSEHDQLTRQAQVWVAQTFFGTLLKQMHESPFKSDLLDGGRGGQAFSSLYDQQLAQRMAKGAGGKLVRAIVKKAEAAAAYRKQRAGLQSRVPRPEHAASGRHATRSPKPETR